MFSGLPISSPSSYSADTSFLQRRQQQQSTSPSASSSSSAHVPDEERGRRRTRRSSKRSSGGSVYSIGGSRLSPTQEVDSDDDEDTETEREETDEDEAYQGPVVPLSYKQALLNPPSALPPPPHHRPTTESTPLLSSFSTSPPGLELDVPGPSAARRELGILLGYTLPICGTHFLEYSLLVVTVVSVGHIGTVELAAASLASMTSNVVALSVIQGFCTALDTLCPQAYTSKPKQTSLHALRTFLILMFLVIPQTIIFFNSESLLLLLKQDPRVAERAGVYLKVLSLGLPGYAGFECMRRWLQAQGLMLAPVITLIVAAPLNVVLNYILVWGPEPVRLGFWGAPLATALSMNAMFAVSVLYAYYFAPRDAWGGLSWAICHDLGSNIRLGLAGVCMVASEWWCWEIVGLASSFLGPTALAAQSILLTSASLFYQLPYAISVAGAVRVGNLLGAQRPQLARTTSRVAIGIACVVAGINSLLLILCRHSWGRLFSSEADVIDIVAAIIPLVALFQLTDGVSGASGGLLRGAGKAPLGALINLTSYYLIGLPVGLAVAFAGPKLGLFGLWLGLSLALSWTACFSTVVIWRMDWEREAERARIRMGLVKRDGEEEV